MKFENSNDVLATQILRKLELEEKLLEQKKKEIRNIVNYRFNNNEEQLKFDSQRFLMITKKTTTSNLTVNQHSLALHASKSIFVIKTMKREENKAGRTKIPYGDNAKNGQDENFDENIGHS